MLGQHRKTLAESGPSLAEVGRISDEVGQQWPKIGQAWSNLDKFAEHCPKLTKFAPIRQTSPNPTSGTTKCVVATVARRQRFFCGCKRRSTPPPDERSCYDRAPSLFYGTGGEG